MIKCVFTIDYEIYGNGEGSLKDLVYEPAEALKTLFKKRNARLVLFVEAAELEIIESAKTDPAVELVRRQIREYYRDGFEIGLHMHPQWYQARFENGRWLMNYDEYNLCVLPRDRILHLVDRSIAYLQKSHRRSLLQAAFFPGGQLAVPARSNRGLGLGRAGRSGRFFRL